MSPSGSNVLSSNSIKETQDCTNAFTSIFLKVEVTWMAPLYVSSPECCLDWGPPVFEPTLIIMVVGVFSRRSRSAGYRL